MLHYIIADKKMKHFYNETIDGEGCIFAYYPTVYAYEEEAQEVYRTIDRVLIDTYGLEVKVIKLVEQTF